MSRRYCVETMPDGRQQWVTVKRSKSYHYHHHHHGEYYRVRKDEWERMSERVRALDDANQAFSADNERLRSNVSAAKTEVQRLHNQITTLEADNKALRRSASYVVVDDDAERLRYKVDILEKENRVLKSGNDDLQTRVHELSKQVGQSVSRRVTDLLREVEEWKDQHNFWKKRFEDARDRYDSLVGILDARTKKMEAYEEILKRRGILC